jgi:ABC-type antimicrobial peptide transport system permease subunit
MLGLFSVLAYYVAERHREFAIRMELGARASQILGIVTRQGTSVTMIGLVVGVGVVWYASRWIQPMLYHTTLFDVRVFVVVAVVLVGLAGVASWISARKAASVDPAMVMREG